MPWWGRSKPYDRNRVLAEATRARAKGKPKKALALLQTVLAHEPSNAELHRRVAPLLAGNQQLSEAWASYQVAVANLVRAGFVDQAVGVLREAAGQLGRQRAVWEELAEAEQQRGRPVDAHKTLLEGRQRFRSRRDRPEAIRLLLRARKLAPADFESNYDLAGLLGDTGARAPAVRILAELAATARGTRLWRTRRRQLALTPTPGALWRFLRACVGRR
jgi:predicted Zn-dependent protease